MFKKIYIEKFHFFHQNKSIYVKIDIINIRT